MRMLWVMLAAMVLAAGGAQADVGDAASGPATFPHAGISLSLPAGFEALPLMEMYQLVRAVRGDDDLVDEAIALMAIPMAGDATAEQFAEDMLADMQQQLAFRDVELLAGAEATLDGLAGQRRVVQYRQADNENVAAAAIVVRPLGDSGQSVCYLLMTECSADRREQAEALLDEVAATVAWTDVTSPMACETPDLAEPIELSAIGCAIRRPAGWFAVALPDFVEMGLIDFTVGGMTSPMVRLLARQTDPEDDAEAVSAESLAMAMQLAEEIGDQATVVSQGPATLGDHEGQEFVLLLTPTGRPVAELQAPDAGSAAAPQTPSSVVVMQRTVCVISDDGAEAVAYLLTLVCESDNVAAVEPIMDRVAEGFSFLDETNEDDAD